MKVSLCLLSLVLIVSISVSAQDEGTVVVKERFERDRTVYFSLGPSVTLGKNLGDYSAGFNFEAGFLKRTNRLISIGANLSYLQFNYDKEKTYPYYYDAQTDLAIILDFNGGDVSIISAGFNLKLNFIPVSDNSKFSFYGIVNPFVCSASKSEMDGSVYYYYDEDGDGRYQDFYGSLEIGSEDVEAFEKRSSIAGGAHLGFGLEFFPAKKISGFAQATFSYTSPISYVSTRDYTEDDDLYYTDTDGYIYYDAEQSLYEDDFPVVKKGFSAVSVKLGIAFNF